MMTKRLFPQKHEWDIETGAQTILSSAILRNVSLVILVPEDSGKENRPIYIDETVKIGDALSLLVVAITENRQIAALQQSDGSKKARFLGWWVSPKGKFTPIKKQAYKPHHQEDDGEAE